MFLQMHADVTNMTVVVGTFDNAPMLGAAILAAVGTGQFKSSVSKGRKCIQTTTFQEQIDEAVACMVHELKRLHPCPMASQEYSRLYSNYMHFTGQVEDLSRALATNTTVDYRSTEESLLRPSSSSSSSYTLQSGREAVVMPSILAADFGALSAEALLCEDIGAKWIHVDVCDGNTGCPGALTVGPQSVAAIHRSCPQLMQDVHVVSDNIMPLLQPLAAAGAARVTFQYEQVLRMVIPINDTNSFFDECGATATSIGIDCKLYFICRHIEELGMQVGVCISPDTPTEVLDGLMMLRKKADKDCLLIDNVDVLAVNPGFGGQVFNEQVLIKLRSIANRYPMLKYLSIDGGVNTETAVKAAEAGANVLIAGSSIFGKNRIISKGRNGPLKSYQQLHTILMQRGL
jgi:ribulose-phosphate 3-epimerase